MTRHDLVGLREADLNATERVDLADLLARDPEARKDQAFAEQLSDWLDRDEAGGPTLAEVRARTGTSSRWVWGAGLALAAATLLWVGVPTEDGVRDRGGPAALSVELSAVAEGPAGVRPVQSGDLVGVDEQVVFWVDASGEGTLTLTEDGAAVFPVEGRTWEAVVGAQVLGGSKPMAFRADTAGAHEYTIELCDPSSRCVKHALTLEWTTR